MVDFSMVELFPSDENAYATHQAMKSVVLAYCEDVGYPMPKRMPTDSFVCYFVLGAMGAMDVSEVGLDELDLLLTKPISKQLQTVINELEQLYNSLSNDD